MHPGGWEENESDEEYYYKSDAETQGKGNRNIYYMLTMYFHRNVL